MAGFGEKKKNKQKLKTLHVLNLTPEKLRAKGIEIHLSGDLDKAEELTRKAIKLKPTLASSHSSLGLILKEKGEIEKAKLSIVTIERIFH